MPDAPLSRRERERLQREALILDTAGQLLTEHGYLGLTMDSIAEAVEYSKGTLYNHFRTKEDLLLAWVARSVVLKAELFQRAHDFKGRPKERMLAVGWGDWIFTCRAPRFYQTSYLLKGGSFWEKATEPNKLALQQSEGACIHVVHTIVKDAIDQGDLVLSADRTIASVAFGFMAMSIGLQTTLAFGHKLQALGIEDPFRAYIANATAFMDGLGWVPLSPGWDWAAVEQRILIDCFSDQLQYITRDVEE